MHRESLKAAWFRAVLAHAGLRDGDTLTVLLPDDWNGPPVEVLLEHARRWFSSPHK